MIRHITDIHCKNATTSDTDECSEDDDSADEFRKSEYESMGARLEDAIGIKEKSKILDSPMGAVPDNQMN